MNKIIKNIIPNRYHKNISRVLKKYFKIYYRKSYSLEGEDMILRRIFAKQKTGFYVDVGAYDPWEFSNTKYFYDKGWRGINIDARPDSMKLFNKVRKRDINLEVAISNEKEELIYYMFDKPALNGFSVDLSEKRFVKKKSKLIKKVNIKTKSLKEILDKYLPANQKIDFLSIDAEGLDYKVLTSNDWEKYNPKIILVEILDYDLESLSENEINVLLEEKGYKLFSKSLKTFIYKHNSLKL